MSSALTIESGEFFPSGSAISARVTPARHGIEATPSALQGYLARLRDFGADVVHATTDAGIQLTERVDGLHELLAGGAVEETKHYLANVVADYRATDGTSHDEVDEPSDCNDDPYLDNGFEELPVAQRLVNLRLAAEAQRDAMTTYTQFFADNVADVSADAYREIAGVPDEEPQDRRPRRFIWVTGQLTAFLDRLTALQAEYDAVRQDQTTERFQIDGLSDTYAQLSALIDELRERRTHCETGLLTSDTNRTSDVSADADEGSTEHRIRSLLGGSSEDEPSPPPTDTLVTLQWQPLDRPDDSRFILTPAEREARVTQIADLARSIDTLQAQIIITGSDQDLARQRLAQYEGLIDFLGRGLNQVLRPELKNLLQAAREASADHASRMDDLRHALADALGAIAATRGEVMFLSDGTPGNQDKILECLPTYKS